MIKFLYVPPCAGSNFLAKQLLWENNTTNHNIENNEYFSEREITDPLPKDAIEEAQIYLAGQKEELTKRIKSKMILEHYDDLPFWDYLMFSEGVDFNDKWTNNFFKNITNLFIQIYETNGLTCNRITHYHYNRYLDDLKTRDYVKHLNIYMDKESTDLCIKLSNFKGIKELEQNLNCKKTVENSENVEYSKIFFDLDEQEIRKLFVYFDKQEYFDNHKYDIIYEFKKYTEENRRLINAR